MDYTTVKDIYRGYQSVDFKNEVKVSGWIRTTRVSKNFGFIELNDGSFFKNIQIVFENDLSNYDEIAKLNVGASVEVTGRFVLTPEAKQPFEVKAKAMKICGQSDADYPLQKKKHGFEFLRTIAHLRPRSNTFSAVFRVRSVAAYGFHKFFNENNFVYVHTPIITGSDCEGAGEMFRVTTMPQSETDYSKDFFGKESNLTVSGQLPAEALAMAFRNVYTFGPTFRAENSNTPRHAAEFWMIEPEMAFADLSDDMDLAEAMTKYVVQYVLDNAPEEMHFFNTFIDNSLMDRLSNVINSDFIRITYTEAIEILEKNKDNFEYPVFWGADIQTEHERYLTETVYKKPVFVTDYPKEIKSFYMRLNDDNKTVAATDMLVPGIGELIGASQREERPDVLKQRIAELGLKEEDYWWYMELRRFGTCVHSGFGIGFERFIMYITGITNIRDVIPFPRTVKNLEF